MTILHWNGNDVPDELRSLPAGEYVVEPAPRVAVLTADEEDGLRAAMRSVREGDYVSHDDVKRRVAAKLRR